MAKRKRPKSRSYKSIHEWLKYQPKKDSAKLRGVLAKLKRLYRKPQHDDFRWLHGVGVQVKL